MFGRNPITLMFFSYRQGYPLWVFVSAANLLVQAKIEAEETRLFAEMVAKKIGCI